MENNKDNYTINIFGKGKLTINHFLYEHNEKKEEHPIYIQVIFNRKTTQVKSCITEKFKSFEEAQKKYSDIIKAEKELVKNLIEQATDKSDNISLKGLSSKIQRYHQNAFKYFENNLVERLQKEIMRYSEYFMYEIKPIGNDYNIAYLEACRHFYGEHLIYNQIKPLFELKETIMKIAAAIDAESHSKTSIFYWLYLGGMEYFSIKAEEMNFDEYLVADAVDAITTEIYFL